MILLEFIKLALSNPSTTLRLVTWRRIINALSVLRNRAGDREQILSNYKMIYGVTAKRSTDIIAEYAALNTTTTTTVFIFPIIDWHHRFQRPQHIAQGLSARGYRVVYIATSPLLDNTTRSYRLIEKVEGGVFLCKIKNASRKFGNLHETDMSCADSQWMAQSLTKMITDHRIAGNRYIAIIDHPYWWPIIEILQTKSIFNQVIYDCMDHHTGFYNQTSNNWATNELALVTRSDFVVCSSEHLREKIEKIKPCKLIRNGCDFIKFNSSVSKFKRSRPTAGYVGAISSWFDVEILIGAATALPDWDFLLVGATTDFDTSAMKDFSNIKFIGEKPYTEIPSWVASFDVCMIPFRLTSLTKATNPVKVYEYLAAGKPVVSTPLPEVMLLGSLIYLADANTFSEQLKRALDESQNASRIYSRTSWAKAQDWRQRVDEFNELLLSNPTPHADQV